MKSIKKIFATAALTGIMAFTAFGMTGCFYQQDEGEVCVNIAFDGKVVGSTTDAGIHNAGFMVNEVTYSTRNNVISFVSEGEEAFQGGSANGPQVTCNDAGGAKCNIDIQVNYSLNPDYAEDLYRDYGSQETFVANVVAVDVRSITREVAGKYSTISLLTDRGSFTSGVEEALAAKWANKGITIEQVSIQEIRYDQKITDKYAEAQAAEIDQSTARANQETARINAETKVIEAENEAKANKILAESMSDEILASMYYDTLKSIGENGNLVIVPEGATPVINTGSVIAEPAEDEQQ